MIICRKLAYETPVLPSTEICHSGSDTSSWLFFSYLNTMDFKMSLFKFITFNAIESACDVTGNVVVCVVMSNTITSLYNVNNQQFQTTRPGLNFPALGFWWDFPVPGTRNVFLPPIWKVCRGHLVIGSSVCGSCGIFLSQSERSAGDI